MFTPPSAIDPGAPGARVAAAPLTDPAALGVNETLAALGSTRIGLSTAEAAARLAAARRASADARARFARLRPSPAVLRLASRAFAQVADPIHLLLLACALAAATLGAPTMAVAIVVLTALRVLLLAAIEANEDSVQEQLYLARAPRVRVRRDGAVRSIPAHDLVAGDVIELAAGTRMPADLRLFDLDALVIDLAPVQGDAAVAWTDSWVSSGRAAGIVIAVGPEAPGAALGRLRAQDSGAGAPPPDDAGPVTATTHLRSAPSPARIDRANAIVLGVAAAVLLAGMTRGSGLLHTVLTAIVLTAMAWSARSRLAAPLSRLAATQGARRLLAAGVFVRDIDGVDRLARLPADDALVSAPAITVTTAGTDDTDRARQSADLVFDAPASEIPRLSALATRRASRAAASAERAMAFGLPSAAALLLVTALLAIALVPSWPASVPLGLHLLLFAWCITLVLTDSRSGSAGAPALNARAVYAAWVIALTAASLAAVRFAAYFSVDSATFALATFAIGCTAFAWLVACEFGPDGWALRRPLPGQPRDAAWLALGTMVSLSAAVAAIHLPRWQSAFETASLLPATWGIAAGLAMAAALALLATLFALQQMQQRSARASAAVTASAPAAAVAGSAPATDTAAKPADTTSSP